MGRQLKITHNLNPDDIYVRVTCQETKKSFRFNLDGSYTNKTCRCGYEAFEVYAEPHPGYLDIEIYVTYKWGSPEELKTFEVQLDEE